MVKLSFLEVGKSLFSPNDHFVAQSVCEFTIEVKSITSHWILQTQHQSNVNYVNMPSSVSFLKVFKLVCYLCPRMLITSF